MIDAPGAAVLGALDQSLARAHESRRKVSGFSSNFGDELTYDYNLQIGEKHTKWAVKREHACFCACSAARCLVKKSEITGSIYYL